MVNISDQLEPCRLRSEHQYRYHDNRYSDEQEWRMSSRFSSHGLLLPFVVTTHVTADDIVCLGSSQNG
jgi:hypothetical protein